MNIALWNASGLDNLGDRLLDQINRVELMKRIPAAQFTTFSPWTDSPHVQKLVIRPDGWWPGEYAFDAIIVGSGALLLGPPLSHPALQAFFLGPFPERFRDSAPVYWNAVCSDMAFLAPLNPLWLAYIQEAGRRIRSITVRNHRTREYLQECGLKQDVDTVPDPGVLLRAPVRTTEPRGPRPKVGIAAGSPTFPTAFTRKMLESAASADAYPNYSVVKIPAYEDFEPTRGQESLFALVRSLKPLSLSCDLEFCGIGAVYGDIAFAKVLHSAVGQGRLIDFPAQLEIDQVYEWIESLDCLITSRLHAALIALVAGTPFVAFDPYGDCPIGTTKLRELMRSIDAMEVYYSYSQLCNCPVPLENAVSTSMRRRSCFADAHSQLYGAATKHFDDLATCLRAGAPSRCSESQ